MIDRTISANYPDGKLSRLDIPGRFGDGVKVNVEMQVLNEHNMPKRTLYYWAKLYSSLEKGRDDKDQIYTLLENASLRSLAVKLSFDY